jgi:hypothetical protein
MKTGAITNDMTQNDVSVRIKKWSSLLSISITSILMFLLINWMFDLIKFYE